MFCVIYRFTVHPGQEPAFESAWHDLTLLIREHQSSLGSRLHRASGAYLAYAQWPARDQWKSPPPLPADAAPVRARLTAACSSIEVLHELEVLDDLLV